MARGLPRRVVLGSGGAAESVYDQYDIDLVKTVYRVSLTKEDSFDIGDVIVFPDGREWVYSQSDGTAAMYASHGVEFTDTGYISYTAFDDSEAIGDTEIIIPDATHAATTKDELRGGYVIIFDGASDYYTTTRQIIGNDAADADAAITVYLDAPLTYAITASTSACEVYLNPYAALREATTDDYPKAGVPASYVAADEYYFWVLKAGICWISPQSGVGDDQGQHGAFWRHDGSLDKADTALAVTVPNGSSSQYAGFCVAGSQGGNGPLFMLQG